MRYSFILNNDILLFSEALTLKKKHQNIYNNNSEQIIQTSKLQSDNYCRKQLNFPQMKMSLLLHAGLWRQLSCCRKKMIEFCRQVMKKRLQHLDSLLLRSNEITLSRKRLWNKNYSSTARLIWLKRLISRLDFWEAFWTSTSLFPILAFHP